MELDKITEDNKNLKEELAQAKIINKIQKDMLKKFELHDDAGTAYIYIGPNPKDLEKVIQINNVKDLNEDERYEYVIKSLYEIDLMINEIEYNDITKKIHELDQLIMSKNS